MTTHFAAVADGTIYGLGTTDRGAYLDAVIALGYRNAEAWAAEVTERGLTDFTILPITVAAYDDVQARGFAGGRDGYTVEGGIITAIERP